MKELTQKQVWDEIAQDWRKFRQTPRQEVQGFIEICSGKLLDLGCGSGRHFFKKTGLKMYGTDFSEKMIRLAEKNVSGNKLCVELSTMENEEISYANNFFDNVICIAVLHCVEKKEKRIKLLQEIKRVLKTGGKAFIQVWSKNHERVKNKGKEALVPWTIGDKKFERYYYLYELEELKNELESLGFKVLRIEEGENINVIVKNE